MSTSPEDSPQSLYQSTGRDILPIIIDPSQSPISVCDLAEQVNQDGGLLASHGVSAALLSMSGYGKAYADPEDYDSNTPANMYLAYASQPMNPPHLQSTSPVYSRNTHTNYSYDQRAPSQDTASSWDTSATIEIPQVVSWEPKTGGHGTKIYIQLRSTFAIDATSMQLEVKFGAAKSSNPILTTLKADSTHYQYSLRAEVPMYAVTGWNSYTVPVSVIAQDTSGNVLATVKLDEPFMYNASEPQPSPVVSRKRRMSDESISISDFSAKRVATMPVKTESAYNTRTYGYDQASASYMHSSPHLNMAAPLPSVYSRSMSHSNDLQHGSPSQLSSTITSMPGSQQRRSSPHVRSWSSTMPTNIQSRSPNMSSVTRRTNTMSASPSVSNPRLVRTSQMSQSPSPATTPAAIPPSSNYGPYAMYPHKAQLKIHGDLDSMTEAWTPDEREMKRRLVQFQRDQSMSTITATFNPVAPEDRQPNAICISCIWWEAKNQYYVTSVDTIFLLEQLVAVRFTVEEKNRIRRNLEGFRPLTVSKGKADSEDFFKLIMGFPNPKPRNIEKDVKVYSWKILALALKKIIGKYSASYGPNISAGLPPPMVSYHSTSDLSGDLTPASPHSTADTALSLYHTPMTTTTLSADASHPQLSSALSSYTTSAIIPGTIAPSYGLYSYPHSQPSHSSSLLNYATQQQPTHHQQQQPPSTWDSALPMQQPTAAPSSTHGMYVFGTSSTQQHGSVDHQYGMNHGTSGP